jgi:hypothetical protein
MPAWLSISAADIEDHLAAPQLAALREAALGDSQTDPFDAVAAAVCDRIRAEIQGCKTNLLSATPHTVPPELRHAACLLILEALHSRLPGLELTDDQRTLITDARDLLKRVARCEIPISTPADPLDPHLIQPAATAPSVTPKTRHFTTATQDGL